jgi:thiamine biosynthesis lipoprotein
VSKQAKGVMPIVLPATGRSTQRLKLAMDTVVTIEVLSDRAEAEVGAVIERALAWFERVERVCSRFDPTSEVSRLANQAGQAVPVSPLLFEATRFALALAELTDGAFDPTIGRLLERRGFNRNYLTGELVETADAEDRPSYRDLVLGPSGGTIESRRRVMLDLGAVAKGLAIDLAARDLTQFSSFCIDAGGDIFAAGRNPAGQPWRVGIRDPQQAEGLASSLAISGQAVCTSGDYERRTPDDQQPHLIDPRTDRSPSSLSSVTVIAPTAMAADGLATAAFILGPRKGRRLLEREGVEGLFITSAGELRATAGYQRYCQ